MASMIKYRMFRNRIIAIGGGRLRATGKQKPQTTAIDEAVISATGKRRPRTLFIPTASLDDPEYCEAFKRHYGQRLGCQIETLLLYREAPTRKTIRESILHADLIYVGGGNTLRMMMLWRRLGIDRYLNQARKQNTVLAGLSAGALCWFRYGNSDSRKFSDPDNNTLIRVSGLDFVRAACCPHYDVESRRRPALKAMMKKTPGIAVALDNCAAIEIDTDRFRIITSKRRAAAYRVCWSAGKYYQEKLGANWQPLAELLDKRKRLK